MGSDEEMDSVEERVLPDNTPARRPRFSLTPKTIAKQSSQFPKIPFTELCPLPVKSVFLYDWWLHRVDPKGLAVGGFVCRGNLGVRTFHSAAIVKRHYTTTLETEDGITVTINGLINKSVHVKMVFPRRFAVISCLDFHITGKSLLTSISQREACHLPWIIFSRDKNI